MRLDLLDSPHAPLERGPFDIQDRVAGREKAGNPSFSLLILY